MRPEGIPADVCAAIEKAMSLDAGKRQASAAEFGHELQSAQRHYGLIPDSMALSEAKGEAGGTVGMPAMPLSGPSVFTDVSQPTSISRRGPSGPPPPPPPAPPSSRPLPDAQPAA